MNYVAINTYELYLAKEAIKNLEVKDTNKQAHALTNDLQVVEDFINLVEKILKESKYEKQN